MINWSEVKEFTPILIEVFPLSEPIAAKFKSFSESENKVYYYEYGFVDTDHSWGIKSIGWALASDCTTAKILNTFDISLGLSYSK